DLDATAARYGVAFERTAAKQMLQASFLTKPSNAPLTQEEIVYCAEDARIAAMIREPQRIACDRQGLVETLDGVVMRWNVTAAEIEWTGVAFDSAKCRTFLEASQQVRERLRAELHAFGIENPGSNQQVANFLVGSQLAHSFPCTPTGQPSTRDSVLKEREHLH